MQNVKKIILLLELSRAMDRDVARGIARYARLQSSSRWSFYNEDSEGHHTPLPRLKNWGAHGIIAHNPTPKRTEAIINSGLPAVIRGIKLLNCPHISSDSVAMSKMAVEHFLERGFHTFAYCGFDSSDWSQIRKEHFKQQLSQLSYPLHCYKQPKARNWYSVEKEQPIMAEWLRSLPKPIALFACNDDRARHIIEACKIPGIHVPEEIAILGVDNDEQVCELSDPPISSIALNSERTGFIAAKLLDQMMNTRNPCDEEIMVSPTHIVTRQSTNILSIEDQDVATAINFIRNHARTMIQVDDVAEATHLSRRTLEKKFRMYLKRSILEEINQTHARQIAQMLVETNLSITEIALSSGYSSVNHLARSFRKIMGTTPIKYRQQYSNK